MDADKKKINADAAPTDNRKLSQLTIDIREQLKKEKPS